MSFDVIDRKFKRGAPKRLCGAPECTGDDNCPYTEVCMCGDYFSAHGLGSGHGPVSMHYYGLQCDRGELY